MVRAFRVTVMGGTLCAAVLGLAGGGAADAAGAKAATSENASAGVQRLAVFEIFGRKS